MDNYHDLLSDVKLFSRRERTELAFQIITSGLIEPDTAVKALGCPFSFEEIMETAQQTAMEENPVCEQINSVSTEELRDYVNEVNAEMR